MTWNDYKQLPGPDYSDPSIQPTVKKWKVALVVTDFPGTPYSVTLPQGSTVFGTPTAEAHDVPRANVANFLKDFYNTPPALNHFQTMNRYWMEDSFGKYGVQLDAFGPYELPGRSVPVLPQRPGVQQRALPDGRDDAVQPQLPHRRARRVGGHRPGPGLRRPRPPPTTTSSTSPPARTSPRRGRSSAR